ncbi:MAG: ABC transporter ATP-binding protein [Pseudodesulfovibrio sp.]
MGSDVHLQGITMRFGDYEAVRGVDLHIREGEFFSLLGSSGCGKTTILRMISGFLEPTRGEVLIGGRSMRGIGPNRRPTALIFQNLALFPLMTVEENIGFGLKVRGVSSKERARRIGRLLELIALPGSARKKVAELSGGQRQRVAIARALAVEPAVLLLDEPLSALDLKLRQHMREELRAIQRKTGVTFIYITHDQGEALAMSDRVGVMSQAVIKQVGTPEDVYNHPANAFVASFVGANNALRGRVDRIMDGYAVVRTRFGRLMGRRGGSLREGDMSLLFIRPEHFFLVDGSGRESAVLSSRVSRSQFEGATVNVYFSGPAEEGEYMVQLSGHGPKGVPEPGSEIRLGFRPEQAIVLPGEAAVHG